MTNWPDMLQIDTSLPRSVTRQQFAAYYRVLRIKRKLFNQLWDSVALCSWRGLIRVETMVA
jgi:hypothetical protein